MRIIAATAAAAAAQTQAASGIELPTHTPTPTAIQLATTSAEPVYSLYDTALVKQADGTTLLIDRKGGYQLVVPTGWMAVRVNEQEYYAAFTSEAATDPAIQDRLTRLQDLDLDFFRLEAIDTRPGHVVNGNVTVISVIMEFDDFRSLEEWEQAEKNNPPPFVNLKEISSDFVQTTSGSRVLVRERTWAAPEGEIYYRGVFFSVSSGSVILDLYTDLSLKDIVLPDFEQVVNSLTLLDP